MKIKFWGTRGSIPVPGKNTLKYGGNTPCLQITTNNGKIILLDAGSGIREFGNELLQNHLVNEIDIFISHTHWDHIQGLPFFGVLFNDDFKINIYLSKKGDKSLSEIIEGQINNYFFPISTEFLNAEILFHEVAEGDVIHIDDVAIDVKDVFHSLGTYAFKITENNSSIIYMTDNEIKYELNNGEISRESIIKLNQELIGFCANTNYLIHDCMYSYEDYKKGWGHSNHISLSIFSELAKIQNLILFHYDPDYTDTKIDKLLLDTKNLLGKMHSKINCIASYELLEIDV